MKKIMAVFATIAAVLGFGFASQAAMAADYGANVTVSGSTATVAFPAGTFAPGEPVEVTYDDAVVADVEQVATKTFNAKEDGSLTLKYTFKAGFAGKTVAVTAKGLTSGKVANATIEVPGAKVNPTVNPAKDQLSKTGAAVAPYAVAVALLAAAGIALAAVRKTTR